MSEMYHARFVGLKAMSVTGNWCTASLDLGGIRFLSRVFFDGMTPEGSAALEDALRSPDLWIGAEYFEVGGITPNAHLCVRREGNFTSINAEIEERKACSTP